MSFRVQFTVSDAEKAQLEAEAKAQGYPNLAELCKAKALEGKATYGALYRTMVECLAPVRSFMAIT